MRLVGRRRLAAVLVLGGLATFWVAILVAAHVNPGYAHRRDYVSTLAARGAEHGWLGVAAVAAAGGAIALAGLLVQPLSRPAARRSRSRESGSSSSRSPGSTARTARPAVGSVAASRSRVPMR